MLERNIDRTILRLQDEDTAPKVPIEGAGIEKFNIRETTELGVNPVNTPENAPEDIAENAQEDAPEEEK